MRLPLTFVLVLLFSACAQSATEVPLLPVDNEPMTDILIRRITMPFTASNQNDAILVLPHASAEQRMWEIRRVSEVGSVLNQRHTLLGNWLLGEADAFFQLPTDVAVAPNGQWRVYQDANGLQIARIDGHGALLLSPTGSGPVWSRDSQHLAYHDEDGIWQLTTDGFVPTLLPATDGSELLAWSPDARRVLMRRGNTVAILDLTSGTQRRLRLSGSLIYGQPLWSPDDATIYLRYRNASPSVASGPFSHYQFPVPLSRLVAIDVGRQRVRTLVDNRNHTGVFDVALAPDGSRLAVWHATCQTVWKLSPIGLPIPMRTFTCDHTLQLLAPDGTRLGDPVPLDASNRPLIVGWPRWNEPVQLAAITLPAPEGAASEITSPDAAPAPADMAESSAEVLTVDTTQIQATVAQVVQAILAGTPPGEQLQRGARSYQVLEVERGPAATERAQQSWLSIAPPAADDPPHASRHRFRAAGRAPLPDPLPGYEHVAVRLRLEQESGMWYFSTRSIALVCGNLALHMPQLLANAQGHEVGELRIRGTEEAWLFFLIDASLSAPALFVERTSTAVADDFLLLEEDTLFTVPDPDGLKLAPNAVGAGVMAGPGETAVTPAWQFTLLELQHGAAAAELRQASTLAPMPETEYAMAHVRVRFVGSEPHTPWLLDKQFLPILPAAPDPMTGADQIFAFPTFHGIRLLPGGIHEGRVFFGIYGETNPAFHIEAPGDDPFGQRFFRLDSDE